MRSVQRPVRVARAVDLVVAVPWVGLGRVIEDLGAVGFVERALRVAVEPLATCVDRPGTGRRVGARPEREGGGRGGGGGTRGER